MNHSHLVSKRSIFHLLGLLLMLFPGIVTAQAGEGVVLETAPPKPVRIPAEFEPMQAVVADWQMICSGDFYKYISEDVRLLLPWDSAGRYKEMQKKLPAYGVNMDNCEFYESRSCTPRDELPWFAFVDHNQPAFVLSRTTTPLYGLVQGYTIYRTGLCTDGGDFMTDGQGTAVSFHWITIGYTDANYPLMDRVRDYWGIDTYHIISNPEIKGVTIPPHIDCQAKFLSPDTIMVVRYPPSNALYERSEATATYFSRQISCYGTPYTVVRLDIQNEEPYINSLIVNHRVFVPILGVDTDAGALATYRAAMPGYEVIGITSYDSGGDSTWLQFWALHCDTMGIADEQMLYIHHIPLLNRPPSSGGFPVRAEIEAYSGTEFVDGTPIVLWRPAADANDSTASWNTVAMAPDAESGDHRYLAYIPSQPVGTLIQYYIQAKDASGRDETHPYIGEAQAHTFTVTMLGANVSAVSAQKGGAVEFYIDMGTDHAQEAYGLAYSVTADANGVETLPETVVSTGFEGTLDDEGIASARLVFPAALASEWIGSELRFSLEIRDQPSVVSDTVSIQILE